MSYTFREFSEWVEEVCKSTLYVPKGIDRLVFEIPSPQDWLVVRVDPGFSVDTERVDTQAKISLVNKQTSDEILVGYVEDETNWKREFRSEIETALRDWRAFV